jgi:hypothetical protein
VRGRRRTSALTLLPVAVALGAALLAGVSAARATVEPPARLPDAAVSPIVVVESVGGLRRGTPDLDRLPRVVLYPDGVLITLGPQITIFPPPALENIRRRQLTPQAVAAARRLARAAGLAQRPPAYGRPAILDATTTEVTYAAVTGRTFVHRAYALRADRGVPPASVEARARLRRFVDALASPEATFGRDEVGPDLVYASRAFELVSRPVPAAGREPAPAEVRRWPLGSVRLDQAIGRCTPVTGPDAAALRTALRGASTQTRWRAADGPVFTIAVRSVLPRETPCR